MSQLPHLTEEQRQHVHSFGVPTDCFNPAKYYLICVDYESSVLPTDQELRMLKSFMEFKIRAWYNERWAEKLLAKEFPADAGVNTLIFRKGGVWDTNKAPYEGWGYRRMTWTQGPMYVPDRLADDYEPPSLITVLERCLDLKHTSFGEKWTEWKSEHPDTFESS